MLWRPVFLTAMLVILLGLAAPLAQGADEITPSEHLFFKAYYVQHAEGRPQQALLLYLEFLEQAPDSPYAMNAARLTLDLLQGEENAAHRAAFLKSYGSLLPAEAPAPTAYNAPAEREAAAAEVVSRDITLLESYEDLLAAGRPIPDVTWANTIMARLAKLWRDGEFIAAVHLSSQVHRILAIERVATMLQRKQAETDELRRQVEIDVNLSGAAADPDVLAEIDRNVDALELARTEGGLAEQIARLYPAAYTTPGKYGLLPLTMGLALPDDPRFTAWMRRHLLWLADQSRRTGASDEDVAKAIEQGKILKRIDGLLHDGEWTKASAVCREMWFEVSRRD